MSFSTFRWWVLPVIAGSSLCAGMMLMPFSPLIGEAAKDLGLDLGTASAGLVGTTTFVSALALALLGPVIDKLGIFPVLITGQVLLLLSNLAMPLTGSHFGLLVAIRSIQGVGVALLTVVITPALACWFPSFEMGKAMGLQSAGLPLGILLGLNIPPLFVHALCGWRGGVAMLSIPIAIVLAFTIPIAAVSRRHLPIGSGPRGPGGAQRAIKFLLLPVFWFGLVALSICYWCGVPFLTLAPGYLAVCPPAGAGFGSLGAGRLMLSFTAGQLVGPLLAGWLIDKVFRGKCRPTMAIGWVLTGCCYTVILASVVYGNFFALLPILFFAGLANPFINVTLMTFIAKAFPIDVMGKVYGLSMSVAFFTGSAAVMTGSLLLRATGVYSASILLMGGSSILGLLVSSWLPEP